MDRRSLIKFGFGLPAAGLLLSSGARLLPGQPIPDPVPPVQGEHTVSLWVRDSLKDARYGPLSVRVVPVSGPGYHVLTGVGTLEFDPVELKEAGLSTVDSLVLDASSVPEFPSIAHGTVVPSVSVEGMREGDSVRILFPEGELARLEVG